jgi:beta-glucanase (GH16 family)
LGVPATKTGEEDRVEWYMDNQLFNTLTPADMNGFEYPFNDSFFFIFNVAVGGNWPGSPDATTIFPQHMIVDYIRVFQKSN